MVDTCCVLAERPISDLSTTHCPGCGRRGHPISLLTVQSQVAVSLRALATSPYHFCSAPDCTVAYFTWGAPPITCDQLREKVFQKEFAEDVLVCYCFRYSRGALQSSYTAGSAALLAEIVAGARQGQCACEVRNPQGRCCLGNVRHLLGGGEPAPKRAVEEHR